MKFWTSILIFQMCFMMAEPVLAQHFLPKHSDAHKCCRRSEKPVKKDCCKDETCAFFGCVCCVVCVQNEVEKNAFFSRFSGIQEFSFSNDNFLSDFQETSFHPPRIV